MTDDNTTPPVGSLGEEAAKLLEALKSWADKAGVAADAGAGAASESVSGAGILADINEHIATGGQSCRYCPVCQLISLARATSPEVRHHLGASASSLLQATSALLTTWTPDDRRSEAGVEHINLTEEWEDD